MKSIFAALSMITIHNPPRAVHLFAMKIRDFKQAKNLPFRIFLSLFDAIFTLNLHHFFTLKLLSLSLSLSKRLAFLKFKILREKTSTLQEVEAISHR